MRISHRGRLTLATSAVSGTILAGLFAIAMVLMKANEINRAHDILRPALKQATKDPIKDGLSPDLGEIVNSNPQLSMATFDMQGRNIASEGALSLEPTFKWAVSMIGKPTNRSGIEWGAIDIGTTSVIIGSISTKQGLFVGVLPFNERERTMTVAMWALIVLWLPLVSTLR